MLQQNAQYAKRKAEEDANPNFKRKTQDEVINLKLKQTYDVKFKVEPFYTGGKIVILSETHFMCQCGPSVKAISTNGSSRSNNNQNEISTNGHANKEEKSFEVTADYECELDEILSFDACAASNSLITAHKSNLIRIWNLTTHQVERTVKSFHTLPIGRLEINKCKSATAYRKKRNEHLDELEDVKDDEDNFQDVNELAIEESKKSLSWVTVSGAIAKVWDAGGNTVSKLIRINNIAAIGFAKWDIDESKNRVFVAERNIYVIGWENRTKQYEITHTLEGHYSQVTGIEWDATKPVMISAGRDKVLILWDVANNFNKLKTIPIPQPIESLTVVSNELYIAFGAAEIRHFNLASHRLTTFSQLPVCKNETIEGLHSPVPNGVNTKSNNFFISTHNGAIYEVSRKSKDLTEQLDNMLEIKSQYVGSLEEILAVAFWVEDKIAVANNTNVIKVYQLSTGSCDFLKGHNDIVLTLSAHKKWLVSGSKDNKLIVWLDDSFEPHLTLEGHIASVTSVCFDPTTMVMYSVSEDTFLKAWDLKCLRSTRAHEKEIHSVDCSPNGAIVATGSRDKTAKLWDAASFSLLGILKGHKKTVWDVKFSSWDQLVATASADTNIKIWNTITFECIQTLQGHLSSVLQLSFFNSGLQIVSSSSDGTLKIWDIKSSTCLSTNESSEDKVWAMDCVPDGSLIVTGAADSVLTVWMDKTEEKIQQSLAKRKKTIEDEQRLSNILRRGDWKAAVALSLDLDRPYTLLKVIREIPDLHEITPIITELNDEHKSILARYIKQWNTNTKTCSEAHYLLHILFKTQSPSDLHYLDFRSILPYTTKHLDRMDVMEQQVILVKYFAENGPIAP